MIAYIVSGIAILLSVINLGWVFYRERQPKVPKSPPHVHEWREWQLMEGVISRGTLRRGVVEIPCVVQVRECKSCGFTDKRDF